MTPPQTLKPGDTIGIAAAASPFNREEFERGIEALKALGYQIFHRHDLFDRDRYLAGSDTRRAAELMDLFVNPTVRAILFARGGYGSQRIIPLLDRQVIRAHPKPVVGFSDLTALLTWLRQDCAIPTFYGPVVTMLASATHQTTLDWLQQVLTTQKPLGTLPALGSQTFKAGNASGPLVGGCLSLIASSMGTPYELDTKGSILFLEEVGEKVYAIDRMLTQLKNAGKLLSVAGIVMGHLVPHKEEAHDARVMLADVLQDFKGPVVIDFPAGHHQGEFMTLPLGASVSLVAPLGQTPTLTVTTGTLL